MARTPDGYRVTYPRGIAQIRFTWQGKRVKKSLGTGDRGEASEAASVFYAGVISGKINPGVSSDLGSAHARDLADLSSDWIDSLKSTHDAETSTTYEGYSVRFAAYFGALSGITESSIGDYTRWRLTKVLRSTVRKERSGLAGFLAWAKEKRHIDAIPTFPALPQMAVGVRSGPQRSHAVDVSPSEMLSILSHMPVASMRRSVSLGRRFPVRAFAEALYYSGLRSETIECISVPEHYKRGSNELVIPDGLDKARWGRTVPIPKEATAALDSAFLPGQAGVIFGKFDGRNYWKVAAAKAGLSSSRAEDFAPHDLRHARITHLLEAGAHIEGVQFLVGHKHLTTTAKYVHARRRHAEQALEAAAKLDVHSTT